MIKNPILSKIHPDFRRVSVKVPVMKKPAAIALAGMLKAFIKLVPAPRGVKRRRILLLGDNSKLYFDVFEPLNATGELPCLLDIHGGGFLFGAAPQHIRLAGIYAREAGCRVFMPDYRLTPKHPFPAAYNDCMAAYRMIIENAGKLGIDKTRIAVIGDSAGGTVAANLCNTAEIKPCAQLLIYPVTDADMTSESMRLYTDIPMWNTKLNKMMWNWYLHGVSPEQLDLASPMKNTIPNDLPPTYVETAEIDCLHDEGAAYAAKLTDAGATVTLNETQGTVHGYEIAWKSGITQAQVSKRIAVLEKAFRGTNGNMEK